MVEWITNTMSALGYWGIGLLMFLENLFPPIPSELIMPLAGFTVAQGEMSFVGAVLAGTSGTVLGALPWYYLGHFLGGERLKALADRYGRWLTISSREIEQADRWFDRHGGKVVFFGRLIPGIRTLISLPAGINGMHLPTFLFYSSLGTLIWTALLTYAGYLLGENYGRVGEWMNSTPKTLLKVLLAILLMLFLVWIGRRKLKESK
jgi:membrane protein DedA with SNARE-associated domain